MSKGVEDEWPAYWYLGLAPFGVVGSVCIVCIEPGGPIHSLPIRARFCLVVGWNRLPWRLKIYGFFNTWGVVGVTLVVLGATSGPHVLLIVGLAFLSVALIDVAVLFPILRARRDLRHRRRPPSN